MDFLAHLDTESRRFAEAIAAADPEARVPSCPDWSALDLLHHLTGVQAFWADIVEQRLQSEEDVVPLEPTAEWAAALASYDEESERLHRVLAEADPDESVYMWAPDRRNVGYIRRRQAHEALIHRLDAELTSGMVTALDPDLATDGALEVLDVMFGGAPDWGRFEPGEYLVAVETADTGAAWKLRLGRFVGTKPDGERFDEDDLRVVTDTGEPVATLRGPAAVLDAWLWHRRGDDGIERSGDPHALAALSVILDQPLN